MAEGAGWFSAVGFEDDVHAGAASSVIVRLIRVSLSFVPVTASEAETQTALGAILNREKTSQSHFNSQMPKKQIDSRPVRPRRSI